MNEAKQAALLPTMPEKDLLKLIRKLELDVLDIEMTIDRTDSYCTISGVAARRQELINRTGEEIEFKLTLSAESDQTTRLYASLQSRRRARLVTRTRRLEAARAELRNRLVRPLTPSWTTGA